MSARQPFRLPPKLPATAVKTYSLTAPRTTHTRPGTCAEADCPSLARGWLSVIDESTDLGQRQAAYIRRDSGRKFVEARNPLGLTEFTFDPGQACFVEHRVPLEREPLYVVRDGDWRGNPRGTAARIHARPEHWVEDFAEHQQGLLDRFNQG